VLFLALKQLFSKKKQSILILLGISFGTMLFVTISGMQLGFREYIMSALLNNTAHVIIRGAENTIEKKSIQKRVFGDQFVKWISAPSGKRDESKLENYQGWAERLRQDENVFDFSPRLAINTIIKRGPIKSSISLVGSIPQRQLRISEISDYIIEGQFADLSSGGNKIVIGSGIAKDLGVRLGQFVELITGKGTATPFKVVGISKLGDERTDSMLAFAHLSDVQKLNKTPGRITEIAVALHDLDKARELATLWSLYTKDKVQDWKTANAMFMEMIRMQDIVRYFITIAILVVAAFGIYNVLTIMINQKKKEIAILRSIGYGPEKILQLIMYQGIFLGVSGGLFGLLLGLGINLFVGSIDLGFELGGSNNLMISYDLSIYVIAFLAALVASLIASFIPAYFASKMTPIDIIRGQE
jgi:lipoprotein-releasing system permease protein